MQDIIRNIRAGISIGNTLDAFENDIKISDAPEKTETSWGNPVITQELVDAYIAAGLNIIRIPVTWTGHFGGAPRAIIRFCTGKASDTAVSASSLILATNMLSTIL